MKKFKKSIIVFSIVAVSLASSFISNAAVQNYYTYFNFPSLKGTRVVASGNKTPYSKKLYVWNKLSSMGKGTKANFFLQSSYEKGGQFDNSDTYTFTVGLNGNLKQYYAQSDIILKGYNNSWEIVSVGATGQYDLY